MICSLWAVPRFACYAVTKIQEPRIHFVLHYTCRSAPEDTAIRISVKQYVLHTGVRVIRASMTKPYRGLFSCSLSHWLAAFSFFSSDHSMITVISKTVHLAVFSWSD